MRCADWRTASTFSTRPIVCLIANRSDPGKPAGEQASLRSLPDSLHLLFSGKHGRTRETAGDLSRRVREFDHLMVGHKFLDLNSIATASDPNFWSRPQTFGFKSPEWPP